MAKCKLGAALSPWFRANKHFTKLAMSATGLASGEWWHVCYKCADSKVSEQNVF